MSTLNLGRKKTNKKQLLITGIIFCVILFNLTTIILAEEREEYYRGEVISVTDEESESHGFRGIEQKAEIEILGGPFAGEIVEIGNLFQEVDSRYLNIKLKEGMQIILAAYYREGNWEFHLQDVARDHGLMYLLIGFIVLILLVGMFQGVKILLTLVITGILIGKVMLPLLLAGYSAIPVATMTAILTIVIVLLIIGGFNYKALSAIIGTSIGVLVAGSLAYYIGEISHLTGLHSDEAQMLMSGDFSIDIKGLLFAGIIIGSLGAIIDVGMSIASSAVQIKENSPDISFSRLVNGSYQVGKDIMGTMANTLILAYVGGSIHLLLLLLRYEANWLKLINMDLIATEVVRGLAGSIGLIVSIPVTALISGFLINREY